MTYWPWWLSGLALSGVMLFHWFSLQRMMAVSGRFTGLVDRFRFGKQEPVEEMSPEDLMAALQAATMAEFGSPGVPGEDSTSAGDTPDEPVHLAAAPLASSARPLSHHLLFLGGLVLGGFVSLLLLGGAPVTATLRGAGFAAATGENPVLSYAFLGLGGALVGFGTRMAGGCTSGHGLCGTSRLQPGSLVATVSFFGAGIATSLLLGALL